MVQDEELRKFTELSLEKQIAMYESLQAEGMVPERELLRISESYPHNFVDIGGDKNCPMDQLVYDIHKGHIVMVEYEDSQTGYSQAQAAFAGKMLGDSLREPEKTKVMHLPKGLEYLANADIDDAKVAKEVRRTLLESVFSDPDAQRPFTDTEKNDWIRKLRSEKYTIKTYVGIVEEPPSARNNGVLKMTKNLVLDMSSIRLIHVLGIDVTVAKL
ncbi:MAG: hypothetical protein Q7R96_01660 [Nanoarchaeota archaeon]|nr:hypothetical protein [Nanoarchaeota archaeon]